MAFSYTPVVQDRYQAFRAQQRPQQPVVTGTASNPNANAMQAAKALKGLGAIYKGISGASDTASAANAGASTGSTAVAGGTAVGSAGAASAPAGATSAGAASGGGGTGSSLGYLGMAKDAYGISQGMQQQQGVEGRDEGTFGGSLMSAGQGAAQGFSAGGPIGAIVGAALGNESYQWQHGNREFMTSPKGIIKSELTGGTAARDIGRWTGLWS